MAPDTTAASDSQAARPNPQASATPGLLLSGRLRELTNREYTDRDGKPIEVVDALILAANVTYRVEIGSQLRAKDLTGHIAPWQCDDESAGDRVQLRVIARAAVSRSGPFISFKVPA